MTGGGVGALWDTVRRQVAAQADHLHMKFFPQEQGVLMTPDDSYVCVWLSELFLAREVAWGAERSPAVHASVRLRFGGVSQKTFVTLVQPPATTGHGVFQDYRLTELLPYRGHAIEFQASLFEILGKNNLGTAIDILTSFASLVTPPVSAALTVANLVASGVEKIIEANAEDPVLCLQATLAAPGAGLSNELRPGWLAVIHATEAELPAAELDIQDGRLCRNGKRLTGFDYMVLRIEGRKERDDWRTPDLDEAIGQAARAKDLGLDSEYERQRANALSTIYLSADLTPPQRRQVAQMVKEELGEVQPGAVGAGQLTVASIVDRRGLPSRESVQQLTLADLLSP
jgi:hypothetical protein